MSRRGTAQPARKERRGPDLAICCVVDCLLEAPLRQGWAGQEGERRETRGLEPGARARALRNQPAPKAEPHTRMHENANGEVSGDFNSPCCPSR